MEVTKKNSYEIFRMEKKENSYSKIIEIQKKRQLQKNYFFVGYNIFKNSNKNIENFEKFLIKTKNNEFKNCVVKLHPEKKITKNM